jgi:hypothetical protein
MSYFNATKVALTAERFSTLKSLVALSKPSRSRVFAKDARVTELERTTTLPLASQTVVVAFPSEHIPVVGTSFSSCARMAGYTSDMAGLV